jgi:hypothetical protein
MTKFRGLDFDTWLYIFMQYAICLAKHDNYQDAYDVCNAAKEANVFYHNKRRTFIIYITWLGKILYVRPLELKGANRNTTKPAPSQLGTASHVPQFAVGS